MGQTTRRDKKAYLSNCVGFPKGVQRWRRNEAERLGGVEWSKPVICGVGAKLNGMSCPKIALHKKV